MKKTVSEIIAEIVLASLPFLFKLFEDLLTPKKQDNEQQDKQGQHKEEKSVQMDS